MLERFRAAWAKLMAPIANFFVRHGVSPDLITIIGTLGVVAGAVICYPQGWLWQGTVIIFCFVFADMVDGQMARITSTSSSWGGFLDSSLDRLGDGAVFGGIMLFFVHAGEPAFGLRTVWSSVTLAALVMGQLTSYVKARAESLGFSVSGGLAARADRLVIILMGAWLAGLGVPYVLEFAVSVLAVLSTITVFQRIISVRRQSPDTTKETGPDASDASDADGQDEARMDAAPEGYADQNARHDAERMNRGHGSSRGSDNQQSRGRGRTRRGRMHKRSVNSGGTDASAANA